jgi:hypothetical protein
MFALNFFDNMKEANYYTLPGPADWWPDDTIWHVVHGFAPRFDLVANCRRAWDCLTGTTDEPPVEWLRCMLRKADLCKGKADRERFDIIWKAKFKGPFDHDSIASMGLKQELGLL